MYYLAVVFPAVRKLRIPVSRDQAMLLMLAFNELLLGLETYLAHLISGTIVPYEWIPIIFGPTAAFFLILAGLLAIKNRPLATIIATVVFVCSIIVGLLGAYFHLVRAFRFDALLGEMMSVPLLVWAPPLLGPLTFALVGLMGISAVWIEDPPDSGELVLVAGKRVKLPYSKTRAFFFMVALGCLATVISSVLDHARTDFENPWLWYATGVGVFATVVAVILGALDNPRRADVAVYMLAMILMVITGLLGVGLHVAQNLTTQGTIVSERFLRGAPFLAPMLFADLGSLGLIVLLDPVEDIQRVPES
jgi:hypothetical protein